MCSPADFVSIFVHVTFPQVYLSSHLMQRTNLRRLVSHNTLVHKFSLCSMRRVSALFGSRCSYGNSTIQHHCELVCTVPLGQKSVRSIMLVFTVNDSILQDFTCEKRWGRPYEKIRCSWRCGIARESMSNLASMLPLNLILLGFQELKLVFRNELVSQRKWPHGSPSL